MGRVGRSTPIREPSSTSSSEGTGSISSHLPRDSVFKHSYKGSLDRQMWGTKVTHRSHRACFSRHALPGFSCHLSGLGGGRSVEPTALTSDPGGEDAFRPCNDAAPFALFGL